MNTADHVTPEPEEKASGPPAQHDLQYPGGGAEMNEPMPASELLSPLVAVFWAKTLRGKNAEPHWHPLICHLLDVAAVAALLWGTVVSPWARRTIARALGLSESEAGGWIIYLASAHDIGKASPPFAAQNLLAKERLLAAGYRFPPVLPKVPHGTISATVLTNTLAERWGWPELIASTAAIAVGGHHGLFPSEAIVEGLTPEAMGNHAWRDGRTALLTVLADVLQVPSGVPSQLQVCTAMWIAGLISVADWIGSNQDYFQLFATDAQTIPDIDPHAYFAECAQPRAKQALGRLGWFANPIPALNSAFSEMFPFPPNAVQTAVIDADESMAAQGMLIIEAPMGQGKTEAALWQADRQRSRLGQGGFYFALPTQATSNQMFHRVRQFLEQRYRDSAVNFQLLHGMASLSAEFEELRRQDYKWFEPCDIDDDRNDERDGAADPTVLAGEWFTHRKRGLLAPFGVGTVDQALLAMLQTRHVFVRHFGLGGKVVIVDEVHAYDIYMSTLLEQLLCWLAALGSSVILLSATLPDERRRRLLAAYAAGVGHSDTPIESAPYPRVSWVAATGKAGVRTIDMPAAAAKTVSVEWIPEFLPAEQSGATELVDRLRMVLADGGCAAIVCNTVDRAQRLYSALTSVLGAEGWDEADDGWPQIDLFHARYPFEERDGREKRALVRFGKAGTTVEFGSGDTRRVRRPWRAVLVATQLIEQSLDLDFDLMVTDLAPVDLVLQRAGRVGRHGLHTPPASLPNPTLWIGSPTYEDGPVPQFPGEKRVYDSWVLLRSWLSLRDRSEIRIPADLSQLVEAVYGPSPADGGVEPEILQALATAWELRDAKQKRWHEEAHVRHIDGPFSDEELAHVAGEPRDEDAPTLHPALQALTRLTESSCSVVCLYGTPEKAFLDRELRHSAQVRRKPTTKEAEGLLRRSVTIMDRRVVHALLTSPQPAGWKESSFVRNHWPLHFDDRNIARIPDSSWAIHLDQELGLRIVDPSKEV